MSVRKFRGALDTVKSDEGNDSLNTFIRQTIELPGWPLFSHLKVQMQKCEKCSQEFCSHINYRRHIRVHRRALNVDKESHKSRGLLGAFWDKLSINEIKDIVSFEDVTLEEVPGSSIVHELVTFIRKPGFCTLPQVYVRAGSALLDIIQARPSRLPISSRELFSILDDASERTFLCAGTAESMQKYVFDGEAGKSCLETKNLVACTSFLVELKLVKAWLADMDAEALRCQKLLVEEEEAAQKRQAVILERKRQKKLRQKEQRAKEQPIGAKTDTSMAAAVACSPTANESAPSDAIDTVNDHVVPVLIEAVHSPNSEEDVDLEAQYGNYGDYSDQGTSQNVEWRSRQGNGRRQFVIARRQVLKSQRSGRNGGFHASQDPQVSSKHGSQRDAARAGGSALNCNKVWTRKLKSENNGETVKTRLQVESVNHHQADQNKKCEMMIGSIPVTLSNCSTRQHDNNGCLEHAMAISKNNIQTHNKADNMVDVIIGKSNDGTMHSKICTRGSAMDGENENDLRPLLEERVHAADFPLTSSTAKAFLAQRWKEAIAEEHVKLVLSPESDANGGDCENIVNSRSILGSAENLITGRRREAAFECATSANAKAKFRTKQEKGNTTTTTLKYIPKQRVVT